MQNQGAIYETGSILVFHAIHHTGFFARFSLAGAAAGGEIQPAINDGNLFYPGAVKLSVVWR